MAIANQQIGEQRLPDRHVGQRTSVEGGVRRGYRVKVKARATQAKPNAMLQMLVGVRQAAREMSEFVQAEILYETIDTIRLLKYLRGERRQRAGKE